MTHPEAVQAIAKVLQQRAQTAGTDRGIVAYRRRADHLLSLDRRMDERLEFAFAWLERALQDGEPHSIRKLGDDATAEGIREADLRIAYDVMDGTIGAFKGDDGGWRWQRPWLNQGEQSVAS